jgi:hypothetical protein
MVWVASARPLLPVAPTSPREPDPVSGYPRVEEVAADAPVRARFSLPCVSYVGSHEGCGCGYNSGDLTWQGFARVDEVTPLLGAMGDDERAGFAQAEGSRARLRAIVEGAMAWGEVEVFGCWDGAQGDEALREARVEASWFTEWLAPIEERVRYRVSPRSLGNAP